MNFPRNRHRRPAFFLVDTIVGFILIGVISLALVLAVTSAGRAHRRLGDSATALRAAERALTALQQGRPAAETIGDTRIDVAPTPGETPAPEGWGWVQVTATHNGRAATLIGLAAKGGAK